MTISAHALSPTLNGHSGSQHVQTCLKGIVLKQGKCLVRGQLLHCTHHVIAAQLKIGIDRYSHGSLQLTDLVERTSTQDTPMGGGGPHFYPGGIIRISLSHIF